MSLNIYTLPDMNKPDNYFVFTCIFKYRISLDIGLFHRAISQSGSAIAPWVITAPMLARNRTNVLGILTGCPLTSSELLVRCLRDLPAEELLKVYPKFYVISTYCIRCYLIYFTYETMFT